MVPLIYINFQNNDQALVFVLHLLIHIGIFLFLEGLSYDEANAIVSILVPASPSILERTLTLPAFPYGKAFIDNLFDFDEDISVQQKLDIII